MSIITILFIVTLLISLYSFILFVLLLKRNVVSRKYANKIKGKHNHYRAFKDELSHITMLKTKEVYYKKAIERYLEDTPAFIRNQILLQENDEDKRKNETQHVIFTLDQK